MPELVASIYRNRQNDAKLIEKQLNIEANIDRLKKRLQKNFDETSESKQDLAPLEGRLRELVGQVPEPPPGVKWWSLAVVIFSCIGPFMGLSGYLNAAYAMDATTARIIAFLVFGSFYALCGFALHNAALIQIGSKGTTKQERPFTGLTIGIMTLDISVSVITTLLKAAVDQVSFNLTTLVILSGIPIASAILTAIGIYLTWIDVKRPDITRGAIVFSTSEAMAESDHTHLEKIAERDELRTTVTTLNRRLEDLYEEGKKLNRDIERAEINLQSAISEYSVALRREVKKPRSSKN